VRITGLRMTLAAFAVLVAGCHSAQHPSYGPSVAGHGDSFGGVDWKQATHLKVEMMEYGYRPRELRFKVDRPYRVTLTNYGSYNHYFNAAEFLRTVETRKAVVDRYAEIKAPYFTAFEVFARGGTVDVYFIPREIGTFTAHCHLEDHRARGVEGRIIVEE